MYYSTVHRKANEVRICVQCNKELCTSTFYSYNGKPYCELDYQEMFAPRYTYCNGAIIDVSSVNTCVFYVPYCWIFLRKKDLR